MFGFLQNKLTGFFKRMVKIICRIFLGNYIQDVQINEINIAWNLIYFKTLYLLTKKTNEKINPKSTTFNKGKIHNISIIPHIWEPFIECHIDTIKLDISNLNYTPERVNYLLSHIQTAISTDLIDKESHPRYHQYMQGYKTLQRIVRQRIYRCTINIDTIKIKYHDFTLHINDIAGDLSQLTINNIKFIRTGLDGYRSYVAILNNISIKSMLQKHRILVIGACKIFVNQDHILSLLSHSISNSNNSSAMVLTIQCQHVAVQHGKDILDQIICKSNTVYIFENKYLANIGEIVGHASTIKGIQLELSNHVDTERLYKSLRIEKSSNMAEAVKWTKCITYDNMTIPSNFSTTNIHSILDNYYGINIRCTSAKISESLVQFCQNITNIMTTISTTTSESDTKFIIQCVFEHITLYWLEYNVTINTIVINNLPTTAKNKCAECILDNISISNENKKIASAQKTQCVTNQDQLVINTEGSIVFSIPDLIHSVTNIIETSSSSPSPSETKTTINFFDTMLHLVNLKTSIKHAVISQSVILCSEIVTHHFGHLILQCPNIHWKSNQLLINNPVCQLTSQLVDVVLTSIVTEFGDSSSSKSNGSCKIRIIDGQLKLHNNRDHIKIVTMQTDIVMSDSIYVTTCFQAVDGVKDSHYNKIMWLYPENKPIQFTRFGNQYLVVSTPTCVININGHTLGFLMKYIDDIQTFKGPDTAVCQHLNILHTDIDLTFNPITRDVTGYLLQLRNSHITLDNFVVNGLKTNQDLINRLLQEVLYSAYNVAGICRGVKYLKPMTNIALDGCNLLLLNGGMVDNLKRIGLEFCEIGSQLDFHSEYNITQPEGVCDGVVRAGNTMIAVLDGDQLLPICVIKSVGTSISQILLGICNTLNTRRKRIIENKYKSRHIK